MWCARWLIGLVKHSIGDRGIGLIAISVLLSFLVVVLAAYGLVVSVVAVICMFVAALL